MNAFEEEISAALEAALGIPDWNDFLLKATPSAFSTRLSAAYAQDLCHPKPNQWFSRRKEHEQCKERGGCRARRT